MSVSEALVEWRTFYSAVAEAGGTLLGLVFVGITIHLGRHPLDRRTRALGLGAILALLHPLLASLVMLLPVASLMQGMALLVIATSGLVATVRIASFETRHRGRETRFTVAYRYFLPLAAELILALAAFALLVDSRLGLYVVPVFLTLMVIVGTQDAVDLLFGTSVAGRPGDGLFQIGEDEAMVNQDMELSGQEPAADRRRLPLTDAPGRAAALGGMGNGASGSASQRPGRLAAGRGAGRR